MYKLSPLTIWRERRTWTEHGVFPFLRVCKICRYFIGVLYSPPSSACVRAPLNSSQLRRVPSRNNDPPPSESGRAVELRHFRGVLDEARNGG